MLVCIYVCYPCLFQSSLVNEIFGTILCKKVFANRDENISAEGNMRPKCEWVVIYIYMLLLYCMLVWACIRTIVNALSQ